MFDNSSVFTVKPVLSQNSKIVFVADYFAEDYVGGAELTTEALIKSCPFEYDKIRSQEVTMDLLEAGYEKYWVFANFAGLNSELIPTIVTNLQYTVIEYDYKFCNYRSLEKHKMTEQSDCDCHDSPTGKMVSAFMHGAKSTWWMSEKQLQLHLDRFPFYAENNPTVLSSVFDDDFFAYVNQVRASDDFGKERKGWIVLGSTSWVKGKDSAISYCEENELEYEVVWGLPYQELLEKLSKAEGLVYLPAGADTCPRLVIEAKLLGCELVLNDNVQHKDELWFSTENIYDTTAYLYAARDRFWSAVKAEINYVPKISGYTTTLNCVDHNYPWEACINSMLGFCDEVVVVDGGSKDGTWEKLESWAEKDDRIKAHRVERNWDHTRFAVFDGAQKAEARIRCTGDFCWQQDADEVVHENDFEKVRQLVRNFPKLVELVSLPVIEYWGGPEKVRVDINPWKWRLSRNSDHITHGIPSELRKFDDNGNLFSSPGSDGCDYVHAQTFERIPHASFYTQEIDTCRNSAMSGNNDSLEKYQEWYQRATDTLPSIHHYSWFNLERKIKTYKNYWSKHWQSLYDISQDDTAENNMFFDKPWSEVTGEDISNLSNQLAEKLGGWIFHSKVDFSTVTPHVKLSQGHPEAVKSWVNDGE